MRKIFFDAFANLYEIIIQYQQMIDMTSHQTNNSFVPRPDFLKIDHIHVFIRFDDFLYSTDDDYLISIRWLMK
jgi:hypothetical protein